MDREKAASSQTPAARMWELSPAAKLKGTWQHGIQGATSIGKT